MKRLIALLAQGVSRLAFWRKSEPVAVVEADVPAATQVVSAPEPAMPVAAPVAKEPNGTALPDMMEVQEIQEIQEIQANPQSVEELAEFIEPDLQAMPTAPGLLDELADQEHLEAETAKNDATEALDVPAQVAVPEEVTVPAVTEDPPLPKIPLLSRLKALFQRKPKPDSDHADGVPATQTSPEAEPASAEGEEAAPLEGKQRVLAVLSKKRVWIPVLSMMVLIPIMVMAVLLLQSGKEKAHLQTELLATQQKLKQPPKVERVPDLIKPVVAEAVVAEPSTAAREQVAQVGIQSDSQSAVEAEDCMLSDKESVSKNLKNCIDAFNRASGR